jgi:[protein-PII] uridylyltransferase
VEDVFFITDAHHKPLTDPALCEEIQAAIRRKLDEQVAETS